jgi:hypothetical protein
MTCSKSELTSGTINPFRHFGTTPWMGDRPIARLLYIHRRAQHKKIIDNPSMLRAEFESTIVVFERSKVLSDLDGAATGIGFNCLYGTLILIFFFLGSYDFFP